MSMPPTSTRRRAAVAWWQTTTRWDVKALNTVQWNWPADTLRPLATVLTRLQTPIARESQKVGEHQLVTIRFDGSLSPRNAPDVQAKFKGQLFAAPPGTVVYSKIDARNGAIGIVPPNLPTAAVSSEFPVYQIRAEAASPAYIQLLFRSAPFRRLINSLVSGSSGRKRVEPKSLEALTVPLPPPPIQTAIVVAYEKGQQQIAALRAEAVRVETQSAQAFVDALGLPKPPPPRTGRRLSVARWSTTDRWSARESDQMLPITSSYKLRPLGELAEVVYGITKGPSNRPGLNARPYLRVANVQRDGLDLRHLKTIDVSPAEQIRYALQPKDVLLCEGNSLDEVGRPAMWHGEVEGCIHQNHVLRIRPSTTDLLPDFLLAYMNTWLARRYFRGRAKQTTNLASINSADVKGLPVPLPTPDKQQALLVPYLEGNARAATLRQQAAEQEAATRAMVEGMILGILPPQDDAN